jgi:isopentenyl diphosphate isomerase/L-lactate dehydrogenase-like FMN-dependent dehydrogenase
VLYGLALGGSPGAQSVLEYLRDNFALVMRLAGTPSIKGKRCFFTLPMRGF